MVEPERNHALSRTQPPSGFGLDATVSSEPGARDLTPGTQSNRLQLAPGIRIAERLVLERKLGMGGMGEVWSARHTVLDKSVAVKFLLDHVPGNDEASQRFLREARAAAGLDHPGIVDVQDFGNTGDGTPYLVMELLTGRPLSDHLASSGRLDWRTARQWLLQIASALGFAHKRGVIHRDLKPSNIFLVDLEDGVVCKLIDFGLAKITRGDAPVDPLTTRTGAILGTPTYMSPEQLKAQEADQRSDLYALGCVAYEMLTGSHAFRAASATELAAKHLYETAPVDPLLAVGTPPAFVELILRCLRKQPAERFQSTGELRGALEALPGSPSDPTSRPFGPDPTSRPFGSDPTVLSGDQLRPADLSRAPGPSRRPLLLALGGLLAVAALWFVLRAPSPPPRLPQPAPVIAPEPTPANTAPPAKFDPPPAAPPPLVAPPVVAPPQPLAPPAEPNSTDPRTRKTKKTAASSPLAPPAPPGPIPPPLEPTPPTPPKPPVPKDSDFEKRNKFKDPFEAP